jgi:hypothetical protein
MHKITVCTALLLTTTMSMAEPIYKLSAKELDCSLSQVSHKKMAVYLNKKTPKLVPQVYLIKNNSRFSMLIDHVKAERGAGAGWASTLEPGKWSAIAVSDTHFNLQCSVVYKDTTLITPCRMLKICQPSDAGMSIPSEGNYWIVENKDWEEVRAVVSQKGAH